MIPTDGNPEYSISLSWFASHSFGGTRCLEYTSTEDPSMRGGDSVVLVSENWWVGNVVAMSVELIYVCGFVKSGFFFQPNLDQVIPHVVWLALRLN